MVLLEGTDDPEEDDMARTITREEWLNRAVKELRRTIFAPAEITIPETAVSCGFPGGGSARKRIGECWATRASEAALAQVFVSPVLDEPVDILAVLTHELIHVYDDCENGHKGPFAQVMRLVGLEGKPTATHAGEALKDKLTAVAEKLGAYPHSAINLSDNAKKQTTRMLKVICPVDDYTVRTTRKWLDELGTPTCPCGEKMEEA